MAKKKKLVKGNLPVEVSPKPNTAKFYNRATQRVEQTPTMRRPGGRRGQWTDEKLLATPWSRLDDADHNREDLWQQKMDLVAPGGIADPTTVHRHEWTEVPLKSYEDVPFPDKAPNLKQAIVTFGRGLQSKLPHLNFRLARGTAKTHRLEAAPKICADCDPNNPNRTQEPPSHLPI